MEAKTPIVGRLHISGKLECRDAQGRLLKVIELKGSIPLPKPEALRGPDHRN